MDDAQHGAAVATAAPATIAAPGPRGRAFIIASMLFAALLTIAYWVVWFLVDRNLLASSQATSYFTFENAFPAADGWLTLTLLLAALGLARGRAWGLLAGLLAGGAGVYLGCMDVLFDIENGIYLVPKGGDPSAVAIEVTINILTFALSLVVITYIWRHRRWFLTQG